MSDFMSVDLVDLETGEAFVGLVDRAEPPDFGVPFWYEHRDGARHVRRVPSVWQKPITKNFATRAISKQRWHPAFEKHDHRGFGITESKQDVQHALDWSKRTAKAESDEWTWDDKD